MSEPAVTVAPAFVSAPTTGYIAVTASGSFLAAPSGGGFLSRSGT